MPEASCHCGAVRIVVDEAPEHLIDCNCSICRRLGALWCLHESARVRIVSGHPQQTTAYIWGAKTIRTMHCRNCGCVTHWEPLDERGGTRFGINARNYDPAVIAGVRIRRFDGAESWAYID